MVKSSADEHIGKTTGRSRVLLFCLGSESTYHSTQEIMIGLVRCKRTAPVISTLHHSLESKDQDLPKLGYRGSSTKVLGVT